MAIRTPNPSIDIPNIDDVKKIRATQWHSLKCQLVTPMYGGGVTSTVVDTDMPAITFLVAVIGETKVV